jgi:hypothetical protein
MDLGRHAGNTRTRTAISRPCIHIVGTFIYIWEIVTSSPIMLDKIDLEVGFWYSHINKVCYR